MGYLKFSKSPFWTPSCNLVNIQLEKLNKKCLLSCSQILCHILKVMFWVRSALWSTQVSDICLTWRKKLLCLFFLQVTMFMIFTNMLKHFTEIILLMMKNTLIKMVIFWVNWSPLPPFWPQGSKTIFFHNID